MASLTGHFLAPELLAFDGPNSGISLEQDDGAELPYLKFPMSITHYIHGHDTALQLKLQRDTATITAVAQDLITNDAPLYYLLSAQATLVPEPNCGTLIVATMLFAISAALLRRSASHTCV